MSDPPAQNRQPAGVPVGGQFAASQRGESGVSLDGPAHDFVTVDMLWCEPCSKGFPEDEASPIYECSSCGDVSDERRCPSCNLFMGRSDNPGCPDCGEAVSEDTVEFVEDHDGEMVRVEDYDPDGASKAERDEQAAEERARQAEVDRAARAADKAANTTEGTAAAIEPGAVLVNPADQRAVTSEAEVLSTRHVETPDGPIVIFKVVEYGMARTVVRRAGDAVPVKANVTEYPTEGRAPGGGRLTAADFDATHLDPTFDPDLNNVSSPSTDIDVIVGPGTRDAGTLPGVALVLGRRGSRPGAQVSGQIAYLGYWDDPETAAASLDEMERAADALEAARIEHPATGVDEWDQPEEGAPTPAETVSVRETNWISAEPLPTSTMQVGTSHWHAERGALLKVAAPRGLNSTIEDPAVLRAAVVKARGELHRLTGVPTRPDVVDDAL